MYISTKKEYAKKVLNDPKLVEYFKSAIDAELLEEHQRTIKFKNALWTLRKTRALYQSSDPKEKGIAFPSLDVAKLEVADY